MNANEKANEVASGRCDEAVRELVMRELKHSEWTRCLAIGVDVSDGIVTLRGVAPGCAMREAAERVARRAPGARSIVNEITVEPPSSGR